MLSGLKSERASKRIAARRRSFRSASVRPFPASRVFRCLYDRSSASLRTSLYCVALVIVGFAFGSSVSLPKTSHRVRRTARTAAPIAICRPRASLALADNEVHQLARDVDRFPNRFAFEVDLDLRR